MREILIIKQSYLEYSNAFLSAVDKSYIYLILAKSKVLNTKRLYSIIQNIRNSYHLCLLLAA